jgi:hypothetical protein
MNHGIAMRQRSIRLTFARGRELGSGSFRLIVLLAALVALLLAGCASTSTGSWAVVYSYDASASLTTSPANASLVLAAGAQASRPNVAQLAVSGHRFVAAEDGGQVWPRSAAEMDQLLGTEG